MKLLEENDPFLRTPVQDLDISNNTHDVESISTQLADFMFEHNAIGLASNQVGLNLRLFVMVSKNGTKTCINPKIIKKGDIKPTREGCLSFPKLSLFIHRPNFILVEYYDINMEKKSEYLDGIEAVVFSHELDHLDGKLFTDRVSKFQLSSALKKRKRIESN
jgi:peptide deformylase